MLIFKVIFYICSFIIFWAMIGYPISLVILKKLLKKENQKDYSYEPTVTIMVVAHNEEKGYRREVREYHLYGLSE